MFGALGRLAPLNLIGKSASTLFCFHRLHTPMHTTQTQMTERGEMWSSGRHSQSIRKSTFPADYHHISYCNIPGMIDDIRAFLSLIGIPLMDCGES